MASVSLNQQSPTHLTVATCSSPQERFARHLLATCILLVLAFAAVPVLRTLLGSTVWQDG